ncbi:hypothetical protein NP590_05975 [Methylomonas sp. SURF-2]|uniref:Uncharacterized protein n=1 Tax=Methylomonas subterranea TaxID=2952225 RepID=A0ABT1TEC6_9GAMM|nr:hypothetical protein [Methylomonas sp. SURF-2]MCQ8103644.1 hypothetical protein [Methylomonas sp. SURF-2]
MTGTAPRPASLTYQRIKKILVIGALGLCLLFPELLWHKFVFILHILYEAASFLLEEALVHGLDMQKYYAQMTVFYFSWLLAIVLFAAFLRQLPHLIHSLKARWLALVWQIKFRLLSAWLGSSVWQKTKFIFFQLLLVVSGLLFLLA